MTAASPLRASAPRPLAASLPTLGALLAAAGAWSCGPGGASAGADALAAGADEDAETLDVGPPDALLASEDAGTLDVSLPRPDLGHSDLPALPPAALGGLCVDGEDCESGYCNTAPAGGYCTQRCASDPCPEGASCALVEDGDGARRRLCLRTCEVDPDCRLDQFCASEVGLCLPRCEPGACRSGYVCDAASGRCEPEGPCAPSAEVCDGAVDDDCDGLIDEEGCSPTVATAPHVRHVDLGRVRVGGGGLSRTLAFTPSPDARGFVIVARHLTDPSALMMVHGLTAPDGAPLVDPSDPLRGPNPTYPAPSALALLVPNRDTRSLEGGAYRFSLFVWGRGAGGVAPAGEAWVSVLESRLPASAAQRLDLNLWFVGTRGLSAATAPTNPRFAKVMARFGRLLEGAGVRVGTVRYFDVGGEDAERYRVVDTTDGWELDEHDALLALSGSLPADNAGVSLFFVEGFTGVGLLGKAGGIPGAPLVHGTSSSGVVVSLADYLSGRDLEAAERMTADTMAHELGHQLGLFHTTEMDGEAFDPISDTGECPGSEFDRNGDGLVGPSECVGRGGDNLMFWTSAWDVRLSAGQRGVLGRNPAVGAADGE